MSKKQLLPVIIPAVSISLLILVSLQINVHAENKLNTLLIEDVVDINPNAAEPESYHRTRATTSDGGDFLKQSLRVVLVVVVLNPLFVVNHRLV